ncbi:reverse transcriptase domain-containing protein [Tanacetum coccineum]
MENPHQNSYGMVPPGGQEAKWFPATTPFVDFSGEIIWPLGQNIVLVKIGDDEHSTSRGWVFYDCKGHLPIQHNHRKDHERRKTVTLTGSPAGSFIRMPQRFLGPGGMQLVINQVTEEKIQVSLHPEYPEQTIAIGSTLTEEGQKVLCGLLRRNLDIFAWKPTDMTGVPRHIAEHRLNIREDLNKACPKDGYPLPEIDWNVESLCGCTEQEVIRDIEETFKTLGEINMKLNPKKCTFGMREGTFLGYKVNADGLKVCPDKVEAVISLPSPKCLKDVQKLNGKLASLNRFLSKSAEKSLTFFKTLKKCTKKSDFQWTAEAETAFKQMKKSIAELPMLTAPKEKEELINYLAAAKEAISAVLMTERDGKQIPIYFVSHALQGPEINYTPMEKLILALILADFIVERPEDDPQDTPMDDEEALSDPWILFTDRSSCIDGSGAGLIITNPDGMGEEGRTWMTPIHEYLTKESFQKKKGRKEPYATRQEDMLFGLPGEIISDNGKQFRDSPFKEWFEKLCIRQCFASVKHPQTNSLVERAKRSLGEGIKERLDERSKNWMEEISHVLWAHRTMIKSSNGETPFSLTYVTEAVIPVEIGMPTFRTAKVDMGKNDEALEINLDLLKERREQAAIQEAKSKAKMEKYYNARVRNTSFNPGDLVYRNNEASHAEDGGKLGPKWEGPYEVTEALGNGAYKLRDRNGNVLPRTWNICNL